MNVIDDAERILKELDFAIKWTGNHRAALKGYVIANLIQTRKSTTNSPFKLESRPRSDTEVALPDPNPFLEQARLIDLMNDKIGHEGLLELATMVVKLDNAGTVIASTDYLEESVSHWFEKYEY